LRWIRSRFINTAIVRSEARPLACPNSIEGGESTVREFFAGVSSSIAMISARSLHCGAVLCDGDLTVIRDRFSSTRKHAFAYSKS
jgi:hypothetical protein